MQTQSEIEEELNRLNLSLFNDTFQIINKDWVNECTNDLTNQILHTDLSSIVEKADITYRQLFDIIDIREIGISVHNQTESLSDSRDLIPKKLLLLTVSNGIVLLKALELKDINLNVFCRGKILVEGFFKRMFFIEGGKYLGDDSITKQEYLDFLLNKSSDNNSKETEIFGDVDSAVEPIDLDKEKPNTNLQYRAASRMSREDQRHCDKKPKVDHSDSDYFDDYNFDNLDAIGICDDDYTTVKPAQSNENANQIKSDIFHIPNGFNQLGTEYENNQIHVKDEYDDFDIPDDLLGLIQEKENTETIRTIIERHEKIKLSSNQLTSIVYINGERMQMPQEYIEQYLGDLEDFSVLVKRDSGKAAALMKQYYNSLKRQMTFTIDRNHDIPLVVSIQQ
ncbi:hypothetical protein HDV06_006141 [Boothiomyces sp. JEL0866]|nr:hypothetical protein HDV06_006141 [Boothiomyces sp. JEL0866]